MRRCLTPAEARARLAEAGVSVAEWARRNGVSKSVAVDVLLGRIKGKYGEGHRAAVLLGLKKGTLDEPRLAQATNKKEDPLSYRAIAKACGFCAATICQIMRYGRYPKRGADELRQKIVAHLSAHMTPEDAERQIPQTGAAA